MKVYCSECKYFKPYYVQITSMIPEECEATENKGNYRSRIEVGYAPKEINKNNNCKWYKEKVCDTNMKND